MSTTPFDFHSRFLILFLAYFFKDIFKAHKIKLAILPAGLQNLETGSPGPHRLNSNALPLHNAYNMFWCLPFPRNQKPSLGQGQGGRESNVGPGTAQTWMGPSRAQIWCDGPPLELKYDVMCPLKLEGPPVLWCPKQTEKMLLFGPKYDVISKKKSLHRNFDC